MNRNYTRVAALAFFLYLSISPVAHAASRGDRDLITNPGERVVRIVNKIKSIVRGFTSQDDLGPPIPKP
jgi:hypothetical protein